MYMYKFKTLNVDSKTLNEEWGMGLFVLVLYIYYMTMNMSRIIIKLREMIYSVFTIAGIPYYVPFKFMSFLTFWESLGNFESIMVQPISVC